MRMISLLCSLYCVFVCISITTGDKNVKYAAVLFRHGDRTPVDIYPNDPWRNETLWPVQFGELTNIGKRQHYALGQWLRKRYSHLLSPKFNKYEIYVRSTDVDRTLMSAQANLAGMYPPINDTIWNPDLMWQPIPIHTVPEAEDNLLAFSKPCPLYDVELKSLINSKPYKERLSKYQKLMNYLSRYTGMKVKDYYDIDSIYTTLRIETLYNFTLPEWTRAVFPNQMREPAAYSFTIDTATPLLKRLKIGPFVKEVVYHMKKAISDDMTGKKSKSLKLSMYSGHDLTVGSVLNGLSMFNNQLPEYTATVFMELVLENNTYCIRISYRNTVNIVEPDVLNIPNCGQLCPLDKFMVLYKDIINVDWDKECSKLFPALLGMSFLVGLALFITIYLGHKIHFARVSRHQRVMKMTYTSLDPSNPSSIKVAVL